MDLVEVHKLLQNGLDIVEKFRAELKAERLSYVSVSGEVADKVSEVLSDIGRHFNGSDKRAKTAFADYVASTPDILQGFYGFLRELFKAVSSSGLEEQGTQWIIFFLSCFVEWSDVSRKFRRQVMLSGLLQDHVQQISTLTADTDSKFVKNTVDFNLTMIFNCSQEDEFSLYYERVPWTNFFLPWLSCKHMSIRWNSKFILGNLVPILEDKELSLLDLEDEEMELVVTGLQVATTSSIFKVRISTMGFSALELLHVLSSLIVSPRNHSMVATSNLIEPLVKMATCGLLPEQAAACNLMWKLLERLPLQRPLVGELRPVEGALKSLKHCGEPQLEAVSNCVLMELEGISNMQESDDFAAFVEEIYKSKKYEQCVGLTNSIQESGNKSRLELLRAKALYVLYHRDVLHLRKGRALMPPKVIHRRHSQCYAKAKEIVTILSRNEFVPSDREASRILDTTIEDIIKETNDLYSVQVCYLCRRNLLNISVAKSDEPQSHVHLSPGDVAKEKGGEQRKPAKLKLARSHFIPRSVLKRLSSAHPLPLDQQTYAFLYHSDTKSERLYSAKQLIYYMLCFTCEKIVQHNGEDQFPPLFFEKIYDQKDPQKSQSMQEIEYGKWLYTFCLGIIFRNLHWHRGFYVNEDEIYQLLVQCRTCLLDVEHIQSVDSKPQVYLLVNPLFASDEDSGHGYMNSVLNNSCAACLRDISLDTGAPEQMSAHFFLVHMGLINILVKFSPAENVLIPDEYLINPDGGVYIVPSDESRKQLFPAGVWKLFQLIAKDVEMKMREYPVKLDEKLDNQLHTEPSDNLKDVYGIVQGMAQDKKNVYAQEGVTPSPSSEPKKLNLLPSSFQVRPSFHRSAVLLPEGHNILLHYTEYLPDSKRHSVLFLCVGSGDAYSSDKPYVIWHYEGPGLICTVGFFISMVDFSATEFLPNDKAMLKGKTPKYVAPFVTRLPDLIPQMLELKGLYSLQSLLLRIETLRNVPSIDNKCSTKKHCWYCNPLCSTCLVKPSVFGLSKSTSDHDEKRFNFCSSECEEFHPEAATVHKSMYSIDSKGKQYQLLGSHDPNTPSLCAPISPSHTEVMHIFVRDRDDEDYPRITEISLCREKETKLLPQGRLYVVFYQRTLCYQRFLEFFVADDFSPEGPLPHLKNEAEKVMSELERLDVQSCIQEVEHALKRELIC